MQDKNSCSRCGGQLHPGFLEDRREGGSQVLAWIPGPIEKGLLGGAKVAFKDRYDVTAFRCNQCGHLDMFVN